jgi:hypothetical protein
MKQVVIFRTSSRFNMVTPKQWKNSANNFEATVRETARVRKISDETFSQFKNLTHRREVQAYLREVWMG